MCNAISIVSINDDITSKVSIYLQRFGYGERGQVLAWVCLGLSFTLWVPALTSFFIHNSDSEVSTVCHQCRVVRVQTFIVTVLFICQPPPLPYSGSVFCHLIFAVFMFLSCVVTKVTVRRHRLSFLLCCRPPHLNQGLSMPCAVSWGCTTTTTSGTSLPPSPSSYSLL